MWAWLRITAPSVRGSTGGAAQLRWRSSFGPWKRPQSRRTRLSPFSSRCLEPVTVPPAPPRKVRVRFTRRSLGDGLRQGPAGRAARRVRAGPRGELEQLLQGALHALGHEALQIEPRLQRRDRLRLHPRGGMPGREERAAVRVRLDGDLVGPE